MLKGVCNDSNCGIIVENMYFIETFHIYLFVYNYIFIS